MTQKVLKVGTSAAVTIPKKFLEALGWKIGDDIFVYTDVVEKKIIVTKKRLNSFVLEKQK